MKEGAAVRNRFEQRGNSNGKSYRAVVSWTFSLGRSKRADRLHKDAGADRTGSIKRNYPSKGSGEGSTAIFDRARSMFVRSIFSERSVR